MIMVRMVRRMGCSRRLRRVRLPMIRRRFRNHRRIMILYGKENPDQDRQGKKASSGPSCCRIKFHMAILIYEITKSR